jgi:hypothetical protein
MHPANSILADCQSALQLLHQLDTVSKRIKDMGTLISIQGRLGGIDLISRTLDSRNYRIKVIDDERGMRLARGTKIQLDAEVELDVASPQPGAAALCKIGRFGDFCKSQLCDVKGTRLIFFTGGHGNLNVVDGKDCHSFTVNLAKALLFCIFTLAVNLRKVVMPYGSIGSPASAQAVNPPSKASTRR